MQSERLEKLATKAEPALRNWLPKAFGALVVAVLGVITTLLGGSMPVTILVPLCGLLALLSLWLLGWNLIYQGQIRRMKFVTLVQNSEEKSEPIVGDAAVSVLCMLYDAHPDGCEIEEIVSRLKIPEIDAGVTLRELVEIGFVIGTTRPALWNEGEPNPLAYRIADAGVRYLKGRELR